MPGGPRWRSEWLEQMREQLASAPALRWSVAAGLGGAVGGPVRRSALDEDPAVEADLRALVEEVAAQLPAGLSSAADHSVAAGRDVTITASGGATAAGVIHGNAAPPNPTRPGPAQGVAAPGTWNLASGSVGADRGSPSRLAGSSTSGAQR